MTGLRRSFRLAAAAVLSCALAAAAHAQGKAPAPLVYRSVHGTLVGVDATAGTILMTTDEGKRMAWKFDTVVTGQLGAYKKGDPVVVIYRLRGADKAVTAVAFPGTGPAVYVNTTGQRVELVGGPFVNGACGEPSKDPVSITSIANGSQGEIAQSCWCCAPAGGLCIPANKTGPGTAFLVHCYE
jgi:hypothetical protein